MSEQTEYVSPSPEISALAARIERFNSRCRPAHNTARLASDLVHLRHAIDVLELAFSERAAAFDLSGEHEAWGSVSSEDWIRHHCDMSRSAASDRVTVGHQSARLSRSVDAVEARDIGFAHLSLIAHTHQAVGDCAVTEELEEQLVARAMDMSVGAFRYFCQHARHAADAEAVREEHVNAVEQRRLRFTNIDQHVVLVSGQLDSVGAAAIKTALLPLARKQGKHDHRNRERRLADALVDYVSAKNDRPHLQVTTSLETLLGLTGSTAGELELAPPISAKTVERLACDCSIRRVLLNSDSLVIDVGRAKRVISGPQRDALRARDKHCRWPGCERSATYTEGHHLTHWTRGGTTDLSNLVLLCHRHHWMVHEGEWQLVLTEEGALLPVKPLEKVFWRRPRPPGARAA